MTTIICVVSLFIWWNSQRSNSFSWTDNEIRILQSLAIDKLPPLAKDHSNKVADNPNAAEFGRHLFFDERFSHNSKVSCATCHIPELYFTDGLITAAGAQAGIRNTPTLVGAAYSPWQFWDGRSDSQWSQALAPLENKREHAASRTQFAHTVFEDNNYRTRYESLFGPIPDFSDYQRFPAAAAPVDDKILNEAWQSMTAEDRETVTAV
ncbi:MAG: cytochrome-c peroxidase, partial [Gammaproteobacteria bacterium]